MYIRACNIHMILYTISVYHTCLHARSNVHTCITPVYMHVQMWGQFSVPPSGDDKQRIEEDVWAINTTPKGKNRSHLGNNWFSHPGHALVMTRQVSKVVIFTVYSEQPFKINLMIYKSWVEESVLIRAMLAEGHGFKSHSYLPTNSS